ncbi:hypothetical protein [Streptomyces flaveus]|uniref:hypothetical protein n=1 Tax=Streptomyces flaveus TaxID=66370 RepID=UPI00331C6DB1
MTDQPHAICIDITGALREIPLGDTPRDQARIVSRALLDAPAVIHRLDHPDGVIVIIGSKNRDQHQSNLYASLLSRSLEGPVEDLHGPVVFAGVTSTDRLVSLPDRALAEAQKICAKASPATCRDTNEKGTS